MKNLILILSIAIVGSSLSSCKKESLKPKNKFAGNYRCEVQYHKFQMGTPAVDSAYTEQVEVKQDKSTVYLLGRSFPKDSLLNENYYRVGGGSNFFDVQFKGDSLIINSRSGGLGGGVTLNYRGVK